MSNDLHFLLEENNVTYVEDIPYRNWFMVHSHKLHTLRRLLDRNNKQSGFSLYHGWYQPWWKWCSDKTTFSCCWGEETEMLAAERLKNEKRSRLSFNFLLQTQRQEQKASSQEEDTEFTRILLNVWCIWNLCVLAKFSWEGGPSLINENWNS